MTMRRPDDGAALFALPALIVLVLLLVDHVPRFYLGDSLAYLTAGLGHELPPDRSWIYGIVVRRIMEGGHDVTAPIAVQAGLIVVAVLACRALFGGDRLGWFCWLGFALAFALDPMIEFYARFTMTDLPAGLAVLGTIGSTAVMFDRGPSPISVAGLLGFAVLAAMLRIACIPIEVVAIVLFVLSTVPRGGLGHPELRAPVGLLLAASLLSVVVSAGINAVAFGDRFGHRPFLNRHAGLFLAGVFAPLLERSDFAAAGVPISADTYRRLELSDYSGRAAQVWLGGDEHLSGLVRHLLDRPDPFDPKTEATFRHLALHATERDPIGAAKVVAVTAGQYLEPSLWARYAPNETGIDRELPAQLLDLVNSRSVSKLVPSDNRAGSLLRAEFLNVAPMYAIMLAAALIVSAGTLVIAWTDPGSRLLAGATIGGFAALGIYSNYPVARYAIPILMTFILLAARLVEAFVRRAR